ncbi:recombinase family protein [Bradyrhizobium sp. LTSP857]|uniref:recombinase family protein n=1 Tax=Bradyrhizobium sp. LTSP857 TaxID=1619231 RepID=UPI000AE4FFA3
MPNATDFQLHIFAALAQEERRLISERTKAALAEAKRRGKVLGLNGRNLAAKNRKAADEFAYQLREKLGADTLRRSALVSSTTIISKRLPCRLAALPSSECSSLLRKCLKFSEATMSSAARAPQRFFIVSVTAAGDMNGIEFISRPNSARHDCSFAFIGIGLAANALTYAIDKAFAIRSGEPCR